MSISPEILRGRIGGEVGRQARVHEHLERIDLERQT